MPDGISYFLAYFFPFFFSLVFLIFAGKLLEPSSSGAEVAPYHETVC